MEEPQQRPAMEAPANFSFYVLLDQYIAIQSLLTVQLGEISYQTLRTSMKGGSINYYQKRSGKGELSSSEMLVLANLLEMPAAREIIQEMIDGRRRLHSLLKTTSPALLRAIVDDEQTVQAFFKLRRNAPDRWRNEDLRLILDTLRQTHETISGLLSRSGRVEDPR